MSAGRRDPVAVLGWGSVADPAEVPDLDGAEVLQRRGLRSLARVSRLACVAGAAALGHPAPPPSDGLGCVVGTRWGSIEPLVEFNQTALGEGPDLVNPSRFPNVVVNAHAGYLAILFGLAGPNVTVCGPASGLEAMGYGVDLLRLGRAEQVLAGGAEASGPTLRAGLGRAGLAGSVPGEGAAFLLLGRPGDPDRPPLATVTGWATRTVHRPDDLAVARGATLRDALRDARVDPGQVTSTWWSGSRPDPVVSDGVVPGSVVRTLEPPDASWQAADGALAAVGAAREAADRERTVLATVFPPLGPQVVMVFGPAGPSPAG